MCVFLHLQFLCVLNDLSDQKLGGKNNSDNSLIIPQVHMYLFTNVRCVLILAWKSKEVMSKVTDSLNLFSTLAFWKQDNLLWTAERVHSSSF